MSFGARALIRLGALQHNLGVIRAAAPDCKIMAVIKANAYGHGMLTVAHHLTDVDAFAVARVPEAIELRHSGIESPIVLLAGFMNPAELSAAVEWGFEPVVHCFEQVEMIEAAAGGNVVTWVKVDTGMNRLGFTPQQANDVIARVEAAAAVGEVRLMTHLSSADELHSPTTAEQLTRFESVAKDFDGSISIGNTPATLGWPEVRDAQQQYRFSGDHWIRPGIALFGVSPFADRTGVDLGLKPVMQFEARLIARKPLPAGSRVGYKGSYVSDADTVLGIISVGYGDGYSRHFRSGTPVLINGRRAALMGNVSMDLVAVDLGIDARDNIGDVATLWGDGLPVEEIAPWADAIPYELVCGVMNREDSEVVD
ncbi:MAG: alanine racemase [Gammaproteobacteria bacterium]|nr:alanine racemase [Gammaproteobacteria bacterium]